MSNEIKVGDRVRVSKDAPKMFRCGFNHVYTTYISKVLEVDDGNAIIEMTMANMRCQERIIIPTKYLVKVDAEAKEPRFKVGDWVKIGETPNPRLNGRVGTISQIDKEGYEISFNDGFFTVVSEEDLILADEPTEQTEAEKPNHTITIPVEVDLTDSYWDAYTADLAKEVALKVANKYNDPKQAAEYAVSVAKAVVDGLKRK